MITLFILLGYSITWLEVFASIVTLTSIALLSRVNIWNWPLSIVGEILFMILFWKTGLFANFVLQIYFLFISIYGWINWKKQGDNLKIKYLDKKHRWYLIPTMLILTPLLCYLNIFSANPITDTTICVLSMVASYLMSKKIIDSWYLWIIVDILCIYLYYISGIYLISLEYVIITIMAIYGVMKWRNIEYSDSMSEINHQKI